VAEGAAVERNNVCRRRRARENWAFRRFRLLQRWAKQPLRTVRTVSAVAHSLPENIAISIRCAVIGEIQSLTEKGVE